jgi:hypothetical protein
MVGERDTRDKLRRMPNMSMRMNARPNHQDNEPLSEKSVTWLQRDYGTPSEKMILSILNSDQFEGVEEISTLKSHAVDLAGNYNAVINIIINHEAEAEGSQRTYKQLKYQLKEGRTMVKDHLRVQAALWSDPVMLSEKQMDALLKVYDAWCFRLNSSIGVSGPNR